MNVRAPLLACLRLQDRGAGCAAIFCEPPPPSAMQWAGWVRLDEAEVSAAMGLVDTARAAAEAARRAAQGLDGAAAEVADRLVAMSVTNPGVPAGTTVAVQGPDGRLWHVVVPAHAAAKGDTFVVHIGCQPLTDIAAHARTTQQLSAYDGSSNVGGTSGCGTSVP